MAEMWDAVLILLACVMTVIAVWHKLLFAEGFCFLYNLLYGAFCHASKKEDTPPLAEPHKPSAKQLQNVSFFFLWILWKWPNQMFRYFLFLCLKTSWYLWILNGGFCIPGLSTEFPTQNSENQKGYMWAEMYVKFWEMGWNPWSSSVYGSLPHSSVCLTSTIAEEKNVLFYFLDDHIFHDNYH